MRYWLYSNPTDRRKSYHTLSGLVHDKMKSRLCNGDVYIFINKNRDRIKLLHLEPGGLVIYSKLLEEGRLRVPTGISNSDKLSMDWRDLVMMVEGISESPARRLKRLKVVGKYY